MKCPYTVDSNQGTVHEYIYDEEGRCTKEKVTLIEKRPFVDCLGEECRAFENGKCQYRGAVN